MCFRAKNLIEADSTGERSKSRQRFTYIENPRVPREVRTEHAHRLLGKAVTRIEWRGRDLSAKKYDRRYGGCQQTAARNAAIEM